MILQALDLTLPALGSLAGAAKGPEQHSSALKAVYQIECRSQITSVRLLRRHTAMSGGAFEGSILPLVSMKEDSIAVKSLISAPSMLSALICSDDTTQWPPTPSTCLAVCCVYRYVLTCKCHSLFFSYSNRNHHQEGVAVPCNSHGDSASGHLMQIVLPQTWVASRPVQISEVACWIHARSCASLWLCSSCIRTPPLLSDVVGTAKWRR